jgi:hypothetical protein
MIVFHAPIDNGLEGEGFSLERSDCGLKSLTRERELPPAVEDRFIPRMARQKLAQRASYDAIHVRMPGRERKGKARFKTSRWGQEDRVDEAFRIERAGDRRREVKTRDARGADRHEIAKVVVRQEATSLYHAARCALSRLPWAMDTDSLRHVSGVHPKGS